MACVIHTGSYAALDKAKEALLNWVDQQPNVAADGRLREIFLCFGANEVGYELPEVYVTDQSAEFVTELQIPIQYS